MGLTVGGDELLSLSNRESVVEGPVIRGRIDIVVVTPLSYFYWPPDIFCSTQCISLKHTDLLVSPNRKFYTHRLRWVSSVGESFKWRRWLLLHRQWKLSSIGVGLLGVQY